ncbi:MULTISPECIES: inositol monophosphatase family protein [Rhodanobacter]|uniref:Inositol monophosphatase/fructose-1,6-bisphosphatase family protein n=1 Tax=Rhodanobacter denitrificans TaxID=666685 RepID=I4WZ21_9GAMM|nr:MULTISPECIES: inositol monophosphatase family protein [Rhodanobacter]AGG88034.1 inositol monophosphatase/fructose-1,6-bisphosphatase family protein [Rhodanobacter denitrificans]EIM04713.1 inositol monophosphatase/fructose-1,6-bisphosphatase family protein [Rhodanobacter denitrificans]UJJ51931.1 inositol-phosphate phosphatase [Rhodanobacter denitrificans]UJJ59291.1 inositol-phosphate phosphatase [Rhodanobacter denitrificans]UJM87187.1 inositol-phosphate phosphatase [Rhodanobacter denitrifica
MNPDIAATALTAAREAAAAAAEVIEHYWRRGVEVELKSDATPVTIADREAEQAIRRVLQMALPQASIYGEEYGLDGERGGLLWLVDPLDGTKSFVRRTPFFSTQIALMDGDELVLGVSSAPVYGETMWASAGNGAWFEGERVRVADTARLAQASISTGNVKTLTGDSRWDALGALIRDSNRIRGYGDFCHYHLLARGSLDLVIESDVNILDIAALAVIVREAGGVFTDLDGAPPTLDTTSVLAGTPAIHAQALQRLRR